MNANEEKLVEIVTRKGFISLSEILNNLKVLKIEKNALRTMYLLTRENKEMPWPAPYQAGQELDGNQYFCCSYSTVDEEFWPEDTKQLNVYTVEDK